MKIRVKFAKHGAMKFIGHLDVMRYFQKALRRSGIAIEYTGGFSPHPILSFASPLGVGLESNGEYFDIQVAEISSAETMIKQLDNEMSPGFKILNMVLLPENAPNAMASVQAAKYTLVFRPGREPNFNIADAIAKFNQAESVRITKQTKKSMIELDLKPYVFELEALPVSVLTDDLHFNTFAIEDCEGKYGISMLVDASSAGNIKPDLVIQSLYSFYNEEVIKNAYVTEREETYGRTEDGLLKPLSFFGENF